jgi:hypothetical protein
MSMLVLQPIIFTVTFPGWGEAEVAVAVKVAVPSGNGLSVAVGVSDAFGVFEGVNIVVLVLVGVISRGVGELMIGVKVGTTGRGVGTVYSHPLQEVRNKKSVHNIKGFFIRPPNPFILS